MVGEEFGMSFDKEREVKSEIAVIAPNGLGYGEGAISVNEQMERGELSKEALEAAIDIIKNDPRVFRHVDSDANDDGCGDGRPTEKVFQYLSGSDEKECVGYNASRLRAKVFGGGLVVASSMYRMLKGQPVEDDSVYHDREVVATILKENNVKYGAHTDSHASGESCGCGAIDKYTLMTTNVARYRNQIGNNIKTLYGNEYDANRHAIDSVFEFYDALASNDDYFRDATGKQTMELIEDEGAVIKMLRGEHLEDLIVANDIDGTTFDQREFDRLLKDRLGESAPEIQVFAFDTWRGRMYADLVAGQLDSNDDDSAALRSRQAAYADFMIRSTLSVAATLTAGDLPVVARLRADKMTVAY
jgi:hypothetical protein